MKCVCVLGERQAPLITEVVIILLLILANAIFAMSEAALISSRKARLREHAERGSKGAQAALELSDDPQRFLSTVQIGITLIGIFSGAFGGARLASSIAPIIEEVPALAPYSENISFGLVVLLITYLSLVVGELVPKQIAINDAERISSLVAQPMSLLSRLATPFVIILSYSTTTVLRLLQVQPSTEPPVTEEEVQFMIEEGTEAGVFDETEQDMIRNVLRMDDLAVRAVMTPRTEMVWLDLDDPLEDNLEKISESRFSYYPVFQSDMQHLQGVIAVKDIWIQLVKGQAADFQSVLQQPLFIPENVLMIEALDRFREQRENFALVIDEHGSIEGVISTKDILEAITGDLPEMEDHGESSIIERDTNSWLVDGMVRPDELEDHLGRSIFPEDERGKYQTLGGFMMARLGHIPKASDRFVWAGMRFEVVDMDGRRVDKVLIEVLPEEDNAS